MLVVFGASAAGCSLMPASRRWSSRASRGPVLSASAECLPPPGDGRLLVRGFGGSEVAAAAALQSASRADGEYHDVNGAQRRGSGDVWRARMLHRTVIHTLRTSSTSRSR
jgi:hypothetical protein